MVVEEWKKLGNTRLPKKLKNIKIPLRKWNFDVFGIDQRIRELEDEVAVAEISLENNEENEVTLARIRALKRQLDLWYKRKVVFWKQLSRKSS